VLRDKKVVDLSLVFISAASVVFHTNSGVLNHWFYILSVGKSGTNDIGSSYNVTGITIDKAAKTLYRLALYLSANSTFANARTYGIQSAVDLWSRFS
jgi:Zn-dependent metalloprotease